MLMIIEGNIGAGKSSLTQEIANKLSIKSFLEPAETNPYLEDFYKDPNRCALEMQLYLLAKRIEIQNEALEYIQKTGRTAVIDRSLFGDSVFAKRNWLDRNIDSRGYKVYLQYLNFHISKLPSDLLVMFMDVLPEVCLDRIVNKRKRPCEATIPLAYLQGLNECYEELIKDLTEQKHKVIRLDWNHFGTVEKVLESFQGELR